MIAVDTNILVFAHREDGPFHEAAYVEIEHLACGKARWAIPWPCIHEFLAVVTHPRIYSPPTPLPEAQDQVTAWLASPSLMLLTELEGYWDVLSGMLESGKVAGPRIHDARIAAICVLHGVTELRTADRDFSRFPKLKTRNPLIQ
jgi:toxin-antitoxin system PIN domain toxin